MKRYESPPGLRYRVGGFELLPARRTLLQGGVPVALGGRAFDVLCCLVEHHGRTVPKDELLRAAWPHTVVIENNLNAQVRALRQVLGRAAVVTVAGRGFRCGLEVQLVAPSPQAPAIAVLPFHNLSGHRAEDDFAGGLAEDLLTALSGCRQLRVIARGGAAPLPADVPQLGQAWGVAYVLSGSVRRCAGQLRIHARLLETGQGACLWSARWDGPDDARFALQDEVTARVAVTIEPVIRNARC